MYRLLSASLSCFSLLSCKSTGALELPGRVRYRCLMSRLQYEQTHTHAMPYSDLICNNLSALVQCHANTSEESITVYDLGCRRYHYMHSKQQADTEHTLKTFIRHDVGQGTCQRPGFQG